MAKRRKWWESAIFGIVGFVVVPMILLFGACAIGDRDLKRTHVEWDQKLASLVEQKASLEEVRQVFLDAGEEPEEFEADEKLERAHELVVRSERQPLWPIFLGSLNLHVQFDKNGFATSYDVIEAYGAL